jgi:nucleotidyltransferase substrate binding protein (TIGR01987 family)
MSDARRLDTSVLEQALSQFEAALAEHAAEPQRRAFRDSVIMHYLFTYELVVQAIKRYLELESLKSAEVGDLTFQSLIRRADDLGLVRTGWPEFGRFREARNAIAHTYNERRALEVLGVAKEFASEARVVLDNLKRRLADGQ